MTKVRKIYAITLLSLISFLTFQLPFVPLYTSLSSDQASTMPDYVPSNPSSASLVEHPWWNGSWNYRKIIDINATSLTRQDSLIEVWVNFTAVLVGELIVTGEIFDNDSIRVVETDLTTGNLVVHNSSALDYESQKYEVPYSTWNDANYTATTNARIKISWVLHGTTSANTNRSYAIYFDVKSNGPKPAPHYWIGSYETLTGQGEGLANNGYTSDTLYTIKSANLTIFATGTIVPAATYFSGVLARLWYKTGSTYRIDNTIMDESQYATGGTRRSISGTPIYTQNKIFYPNALTVAGSHKMNLTYEIFENSIFTKVTCSFLALAAATNLQVRYYGDRDTVNVHTDGEGHTYAGGGTSSGNTNKWTACWVTAQTDLLGFVVNSYQNVTTTANDAFSVQGNIGGLTGNGQYDEFSFYMVTCAKGTPEYKPVEDLWKDLIQTPKTYSFSTAERRRAAIFLSLVDTDGFILPGATVYLNASQDWSGWNDSAITDANGQCAFYNKMQGDYNFTVNMTAPFENISLTTNASSIVSCALVNNHIELTTSAYRLTFYVRDHENLPLPHDAWISINKTESGYLNNVSLNTNGTGVFRWENDTDYTYTLCYRDPLYNGNNSIDLESGTILWGAHTPGTSQEKVIAAGMTSVNFTVTDQTTSRLPVIGAILRVYNGSLVDGSPDHSKALVNLTATVDTGNTQLYWRTKSASENYSFELYLGNTIKNLNTSDSGDYTLNYQNFTMDETIQKDVRVQVDTSLYKGKIVPVNDPYWEAYWNETLVVQVIYQHDNAKGYYEYAVPSTITCTVKNSLQQVLAGPFAMDVTSQTGRYEAPIDMIALGMSAGSTYSLTIDATEAGFSAITAFSYNVKVLAIPTELTSDTTTFSARWGDINSTILQLDAVYSEVLTSNYPVTNQSQWVPASFTYDVPFITNEWNLTRVVFNFSNFVKETGQNIVFKVYDDASDYPSSPYGSNFSTVAVDSLTLTINGQWKDDDLTFFIESSGIVGYSYTYTTHAYYQRTGIVRNQTINNVQIAADGSTTLEYESPGNGWSVKDLKLHLDNSSNLPASFNFTWWDHSYRAITKEDEVYSGLNWYLDPETDSIAIAFNSSESITFNATISLTLEQVTDKHPYAETDEILFPSTLVTSNFYQCEMPITNSKQWQVTEYQLEFSGFRNDTGELVNPSEIDLQFSYGSTTTIVSDGEEAGKFVITITSPTQIPTLAFNLLFNELKTTHITYNLTITRSSTWLNRWGLSSVPVTYYVFSNNSITGTAVTSADVSGRYLLSFDTSRTTIGTQILKVSASLANYDEASVDLTFNIAQIYTRINGTTFFYRNSEIKKTEPWIYDFNYTDTYNLVGGQPVGIIGAIATFDVGYYSLSDPNAQSPLWTDEGALTDNTNGLYTLDYNTDTLEVGIYVFAIKIVMPNDVYESRTATLNVRIELIPSSLLIASSDLVQDKVQRDNATYSFRLVDGRVGHSTEYYLPADTIATVTFTSSLTFNSAYLSWVNGTSDGFFNLTIDTRSIAAGTYTLQVSFARVNYTTNSTGITLQVARFEPSVILPTGVISVQELLEARIDLQVKDTLPELGQIFEHILIRWYVSGTDLSGEITTVSTDDGKYQIVFPTTSLPPNENYEVVITVNVTVGGVNYTYQTTTLKANVRVDYEQIFGIIPRPYFWILVIGMAVLVGSLVLYRYVRYLRIPVFVREVQRTRALIRKGKTLGRESVAESRGESISHALQDRYASLGLTASDKFVSKATSDKAPTGERNPDEEVA